ncbi:hypothetical protein NL676_015513 [Syzygium grande]|nr:hypothetical protein NL676_015513 [Syzygium grande]
MARSQTKVGPEEAGNDRAVGEGGIHQKLCEGYIHYEMNGIATVHEIWWRYMSEVKRFVVRALECSVATFLFDFLIQ